MQKTHVSRAMKLLVNKGIILKVKEGTTTGYKLNPTYGWKGKVSNMKKEQDRLLEKKIIDLDRERELRNPTPPETANLIDIPPEEIPF